MYGSRKIKTNIMDTPPVVKSPCIKPAALQPILPIVYCDAIYTVRAQNCPLKSNGQPVTKFMLFCRPAVLTLYVDTFFSEF